MKKQSNTPEIRFQNYEDKWDVEKLINIFEIIRNAESIPRNHTRS